MKAWALLLVLLTACAAPEPPKLLPADTGAECNCMWYAYEALKRINVRLRTVPAVVISDEHGGHGFYSRGVVYLPDNTDCKVMTHEFLHHYQREHYGEKVDRISWWLNEFEAQEKTARAINVMGACK